MTTTETEYLPHPSHTFTGLPAWSLIGDDADEADSYDMEHAIDGEGEALSWRIAIHMTDYGDDDCGSNVELDYDKAIVADYRGEQVVHYWGSTDEVEKWLKVHAPLYLEYWRDDLRSAEGQEETYAGLRYEQQMNAHDEDPR